MSDDTINTPQDTTPVTPEPASAESVDFLLDELSGAGVVEVKQEAAPVVEDKKIKVTVPPAVSARTGDDPPMLVWSGMNQGESRSTLQNISAVLSSNADKSTHPDSDWVQATFDAHNSTVPFGDYYVEPLQNKKAQWRQEYGTANLAYANYWNIEKIDHGEVLTGEKARRLARIAIGGGSTENFPLWQSGFWITVTPPLEADWNLLDEELNEHRRMFGWDHYGVAFSNYSVYLMERLKNFALRFITTCSIYDEEAKKMDGSRSAGEVVDKYIDYFDIPILLAYVAHASYPNGFPYVRPTELRPITGGGGSLVPEMLNLYRSVLHDFARIDEWQVNHMASRRRWSTPVEKILEYQEHVSKHRVHNAEVVVNPSLTLVLDAPNMASMIRSTDAWLASMKMALAASLTQEREDGSRQESIRRHSRMAHLRSLSPWVRSMRVTKDGRTAHIESEEDIEFILCDARNDTKLSESIYVGIVKYIGTTSISVTAVAVDPELPDMPTDKQDESRQKIVPIDILSLVFTLLEHARAKAKG